MRASAPPVTGWSPRAPGAASRYGRRARRNGPTVAAPRIRTTRTSTGSRAAGLRRPDGRAEVLRVPPNLPLGIDAADYTCTHVDLPPGSVLVLCTDGLVEAPGVDLLDSVRAMAARLEDAGDLDAEGLADVLVDDVRRSTHRGDDVAVPALRTR
ncbi:serine/threonine-protein phosphatase [Streptomyces sp. Akac8]|nr:serine/threonine-protein phosphatase [Streptomyces sp. Akac8]